MVICMTQDRLNNAYFDWMYRLVFPFQNDISYRRLLGYLNNATFYPIISMDENRVQDGIGLRYRFGHENRYSDAEIACLVDLRPCSVLEMMVALAIRIEESIMSNSQEGDRTHIWFSEMIESLGCSDMTDDNFDRRRVNDVITTFLERRYSRDGRGGLFTIPNSPRDLRSAEIWYQANWYLGTIVNI